VEVVHLTFKISISEQKEVEQQDKDFREHLESLEERVLVAVEEPEEVQILFHGMEVQDYRAVLQVKLFFMLEEEEDQPDLVV